MIYEKREQIYIRLPRPFPICMDSRFARLQEAASSTNRRQRITPQIVNTEKITADVGRDRQQIKELALKNLQEEESTKDEHITEQFDTKAENVMEPIYGTLLKHETRPRPRFVPKGSRDTIAEREAELQKEAEIYDTMAAKEDRHQRAREMVANYISRDMEAERRKKEEALHVMDAFNPLSVDDTDGLDPETEYLEWTLRHLERMKRDKDEDERFEKEKAELERIRGLTEEERRKIDEEKQQEWESTQPRTQMKFMQKYYHKGAFFQDTDDTLLKRDYNEPTLLDKQNKEVLPSAMQTRDSFGKRSRSKWTHLTAEDTTSFEYGWGSKDNPTNYETVSKMSGMRGSNNGLSPNKKPKQQ